MLRYLREVADSYPPTQLIAEKQLAQLRDQATLDIERPVSNRIVANDHANTIADYYSFAAINLPLTEVSAA